MKSEKKAKDKNKNDYQNTMDGVKLGKNGRK